MRRSNVNGEEQNVQEDGTCPHTNGKEEQRPTYDSTMLGTYLSCPRKYYWRAVENLVPLNEGKALSFGHAVHEALNTWYELWDVEAAIAKFHANYEDSVYDTLRTHETGEKLLRQYAKEYPKEAFEILALERGFELMLPNGLPYCGRFDMVIKWGEMYLVMDHKTTSRMGDSYMQQWRPNLQMRGYCWAAEQIFKVPIHGILINCLYMTTKKIEFHRDIVPLERWEPQEFVEVASNLTTEIAIKRALTSRRLADGHDAPDCRRPWRPNWTSCTDWGHCIYRDLCCTDQPERLIDGLFERKVWSPLTQEEGSGE
jgi:CRISPR/Cas system-associated exonuclease Cas4 (RecB family)